MPVVSENHMWTMRAAVLSRFTQNFNQHSTPENQEKSWESKIRYKKCCRPCSSLLLYPNFFWLLACFRSRNAMSGIVTVAKDWCSQGLQQSRPTGWKVWKNTWRVHEEAFKSKKGSQWKSAVPFTLGSCFQASYDSYFVIQQ